jgi:hypothetical protein
MNIDPPVPFDPSEALSLFAEPEQERYGLSDRIWFYTINTCRAVENFAESSFTIDKVFGPPGLTPSGCWVEFVIKSHVFWVDVSPTRVKLWASLADDPEVLRNRYLVHDGEADNPAVWESLLKTIGRVEQFGVFMNHADTLRRMWSEWLIEKQRRDDERGF